MRSFQAMLVSSVMMPRIFAALLFVAALPALAQPADKTIVAVINGETITAKQLDEMYERLPQQMYQQYENDGGKAAFLNNYVGTRLLVQHALKAGFDKRPVVQAEIEAAKETTIFNRYVNDVVASPIINDAAIRQFYDEHPSQFVVPEKIHLRHIIVTTGGTGPQAKSKERAQEMINTVAAQLHEMNAASRNVADPKAAAQLRVNQFAQLARQYSEDAAAQSGGDLGWLVKGQLDPTLEEAAFGMATGIPSGIIETKFGYHIILVEAKQPAGTESFEHARSAIRGYLMNQHASEVMAKVAKLTDGLRANSKIEVYPENIK